MSTRDQCRRALSIHEETLSRVRDVIGLGIVPLEESPREYAVAVYVRGAGREMAKKGRVPSVLRIPGRRGEVEVPTRIIEQGEVRLE